MRPAGFAQAAALTGIDTDRLPTLPLWQTVTTIVYNVAIAAKAVGLL